MFKYLIFVLVFFQIACSDSNKEGGTVYSTQFIAANHHSATDHAAQFIFSEYQKLLTGISNQDTSFLLNATESLIHMNDSLASLPMQLDSNLDQNWKIGLQNINAELIGLKKAISVNDLNEVKLAIHMTGLHFLNLLGQIGYQENTIYIFNEIDKKNEDGYTWLGIQKTARDPFHAENHKPVSAVQVLQELK
jgi:hypothetical protein